MDAASSPADPRRRNRRRWLIGAGIVVSAVALYLTFRRVPLGEVFARIEKIDPIYIAAAIAIRGLLFLLVAARTRILIAALGAFRYASLVKSHLVAFAVNNLIPLRAGELARVGYLARVGNARFESCLAVVVTERMLELLLLCVLLAVALSTTVAEIPLGASLDLLLAGCIGGIALAVVVSRRPNAFVTAATRIARLAGASFAAAIEVRARRFAEGLSGLGRVRAVAAVTLLTLMFWAGTAINVWLVARSLGIVLTWSDCFVVLAFLSFGLAVPSTPGNIGTYHFFAAAALTALGFDREHAISFAVVIHAVAVVPYMLVSVPVLATDYRKLTAPPAAL
jgi:hypothetical protein